MRGKELLASCMCSDTKLGYCMQHKSGHQPSLEAWKEPNSGWSGSSESDIRIIVWDDKVQSADHFGD